eukprot:Hpha_TRINITY_DN424_c0_g1::TRINITY_DN424_c0_g1_i1::g.27680::m.27680
MALIIAASASLAVWSGEELAAALSEIRQLLQFLKENVSSEKPAEDESPIPFATPYIHPQPPSSDTGASEAGLSLRSQPTPAERAARVRTGLAQELERLANLHSAIAQGDEGGAKRCGAGDAELTQLALQLSAVVHDCVGTGRIGISQDNFLQFETILEQSAIRLCAFVQERRREEQVEEAELKDRLRSHEERMRARMKDMRDTWEQNAAADSFLNSADQRRLESESESLDLISREVQRRQQELSREQEEEEERRKAVTDTTGLPEQELRRRAEKLERLRQSERNRALRKGYSTNPDYRPPQEFRFGN